MSTQGHIAALQRRHSELERQIEEEMSHYAQDELLISSLKRKKLEIKDELARMEAQAAA